MLELAFALKRERPERTAAQVREIMLTTAGDASRCRGCGRCRRTSPVQGLNVRADGRADRGRSMAASRPTVRNELWTGDGLARPDAGRQLGAAGGAVGVHR